MAERHNLIFWMQPSLVQLVCNCFFFIASYLLLFLIIGTVAVFMNIAGK